MKFVVLSLSLLLATAALAESKTCKVDMKAVSELLNTDVEEGAPVVVGMELVYGGETSSVTYRSNNGQVITTPVDSSSADYVIREGLDGSELDLNPGESIVMHARATSGEPVLSETFTTGLDLALVKKVKLHILGEATEMGALAVVVAFDATGAELGSFMGGFFVRPCLK